MLLAACSAPPVRQQPVGRMHVRYEDPERVNWVQEGPRPLLTTLWYPAVAGTAEADWTIGVFAMGRNAENAPMADAPAKLPLVVLSHGTGGAAAQLSWLAEELASNGYLVAAVSHHGNTGAEPAYALQGFMLWWERARDISMVIDRLLADARFGPRIDTTRIGAAGFSLGGYTVLEIAGARTDRLAWERFCEQAGADPSCVLPPEAPFTRAQAESLVVHDPVVQRSIARSGDSYLDGRVKAVYAMAPVLGPAYEPASLDSVAIPVRIVVGARDDQAVPDVTARPVATRISGATLDILPGVSHYAFLAECTLRGRMFLRQLCADAGPIERGEHHIAVATDARAFFDQSLSGSSHE
ncbi:MAG: prolyl oligopeptidase family serine peptidase [Rhodothermales bacterium]